MITVNGNVMGKGRPKLLWNILVKKDMKLIQNQKLNIINPNLNNAMQNTIFIDH